VDRAVPPFALDRLCPYCGGTVAPNFTYCTHCANEVPVQSPESAPRDDPAREHSVAERGESLGGLTADSERMNG